MNEINDKKYINIQIPKSLAEKILKRIKGTEFSSISSYVIYVLSEILSETEETFTKEDEEKVKERLRALGYLD